MYHIASLSGSQLMESCWPLLVGKKVSFAQPGTHRSIAGPAGYLPWNPGTPCARLKKKLLLHTLRLLLFHAKIAPPNRPALLDTNTESMILRASTRHQEGVRR